MSAPEASSAPGAEPGGSKGLAEALGAYTIWGFLPLYLKPLQHIAPWEVVGERVIWSVVLLMILLIVRKRLGEFRRVMSSPRLIGPLLASAILIGANWMIYIWAVNNGHVLAASLGYFLNPLLNVVLGAAILKEKLRPLQWAATGLAAVGVAILAFGALDTLWISVALAGTFGFYGLIRKMIDTGPMVGLAAETVLLLPFAIIFLLWWHSEPGRAAFGQGNMVDNLLLMGCGVVTAVPLLLFASAARKLPYSTLGLVQYLAPTIVLLLGLFVYHEPLKQSQIVCFAFIWAGLGIYIYDSLRAVREARAG